MGGKRAAKQAAKDAAQARADELARQNRIKQGTANIDRTFGEQFNNQFYDGIANSYSDFARPQFDEQRRDANGQLIYDLARSGKLDSSTRATKGAELQETYDLGLQEIADRARGMSNDSRSAVEDARSALIAQVNATGDATGATNAAVRRAAALSQPAGEYSALADMFGGFTDTLGRRYAAERAFAASGGMSAGYKPVSHGARGNAVRVTG